MVRVTRVHVCLAIGLLSSPALAQPEGGSEEGEGQDEATSEEGGEAPTDRRQADRDDRTSSAASSRRPISRHRSPARRSRSTARRPSATTDDEGHFELDGRARHVQAVAPRSPASSPLEQHGHASRRARRSTLELPARDDRRLLNETIVVVGSRTPRTNVESPVAGRRRDRRGDRRAAAAPRPAASCTRSRASFISTPQTIADGSDHVDPASLRGLGPDQVLVLVNGKRRHRSALMHVNGTFGRGTVGTDLNAIAVGSIKRIEILRDGAAAQYGSDAIAGVINIVTKDSPTSST